jgi:hypothetical protein
MRTDRELLEFAAKAAGVEYIISAGQLWTTMDGSINKWTERWNPLANDGQALRLAVKLELDVTYSDSHVFVNKRDEYETFVALGGNRYVDTRRAITTAAAELGEQL